MHTAVYILSYWKPACLLVYIHSRFVKKQRLVTAGNLLSATAICSNLVRLFLQCDNTQCDSFCLSQKINAANDFVGIQDLSLEDGFRRQTCCL